MDFSKLTRLRQATVEKPCPEDWDAMQGDARQRFCSGCGCFVHNLAGLRADEAEELLESPNRVCTRLTVDAKKGVLTRDGWIPRLVAAGAIAATVAGCSPADPEIEQGAPMMGKTAVDFHPPKEEKPKQELEILLGHRSPIEPTKEIKKPKAQKQSKAKS